LLASAGEARRYERRYCKPLEAQRASDRGEHRAQRGLTSDRAVEETMTKVLYKPVGVLVSVLGGVLAGTIF
jgi:hypothetical protein